MSNKRSKNSERMKMQAKPSNRTNEKSLPKTMNIVYDKEFFNEINKEKK